MRQVCGSALNRENDTNSNIYVSIPLFSLACFLSFAETLLSVKPHSLFIVRISHFVTNNKMKLN